MQRKDYAKRPHWLPAASGPACTRASAYTRMRRAIARSVKARRRE